MAQFSPREGLLLIAYIFIGIDRRNFIKNRLFFTGARNGHLPDFLALINPKFSTPLPALMFVVSELIN